jgi:hypothetical protein
MQELLVIIGIHQTMEMEPQIQKKHLDPPGKY